MRAKYSHVISGLWGKPLASSEPDWHLGRQRHPISGKLTASPTVFLQRL
jgi:hypothetical protein